MCTKEMGGILWRQLIAVFRGAMVVQVERFLSIPIVVEGKKIVKPLCVFLRGPFYL